MFLWGFWRFYYYYPVYYVLWFGFILTYAIVVMTDLSKLDNKEFIKAFQVIERIIQNNQPIFIFIWVGSIISIICTIIVSIMNLGVIEYWLIILISILYLSGVQGIAVLIHLPLNKHIQKINVDTMNFQELSYKRRDFEIKWNYFNKTVSFDNWKIRNYILNILVKKV